MVELSSLLEPSNRHERKAEVNFGPVRLSLSFPNLASIDNEKDSWLLTLSIFCLKPKSIERRPILYNFEVVSLLLRP